VEFSEQVVLEAENGAFHFVLESKVFEVDTDQFVSAHDGIGLLDPALLEGSSTGLFRVILSGIRGLGDRIDNIQMCHGSLLQLGLVQIVHLKSTRVRRGVIMPCRPSRSTHILLLSAIIVEMLGIHSVAESLTHPTVGQASLARRESVPGLLVDLECIGRGNGREPTGHFASKMVNLVSELTLLSILLERLVHQDLHTTVSSGLLFAGLGHGIELTNAVLNT